MRRALRHLPWWTLGFLTCALVAQWVPCVAQWLLYDRAAIVSGEWWRVATGHVVHFSPAHLVANVAVVAPAGWLVESRTRSDATILLAGGAAAIGVTLFLGEPALPEFGGASGIAFALLTYACLRGLHDGARSRALCAVVLALATAKLVAECVGWQVHDWQADGFVPITLSHVAGAASGWALYLWRAMDVPMTARRPPLPGQPAWQRTRSH